MEKHEKNNKYLKEILENLNLEENSKVSISQDILLNNLKYPCEYHRILSKLNYILQDNSVFSFKAFTKNDYTNHNFNSTPSLDDIKNLLSPNWEFMSIEDKEDKSSIITIKNKKNLKSRVKNIIFPPLQNASDIRQSLNQIEQAQWLPEKKIEQLQFLQLQEVLKFAKENSPYYKETLKDINPEAINSYNDLLSLPLLNKKDLYEQLEKITTFEKIPEHAPFGETTSSGSTNDVMMVKTIKSKINQLFFYSHSMREVYWNKRDFKDSYAIIKPNLKKPEPSFNSNWGLPFTLFSNNTGKSCYIPISIPIAEQLSYLIKEKPDYLITFSSIIRALITEAKKQNIKLDWIKEVKLTGETITDEIIYLIKDNICDNITSVYSSEELGGIAMKCPECNNFHVMEGVIVEILNDNNQPCQTGEIGRLVITDLHNFATPLIRYNICDYAIKEDNCICGRGLKTIRQIMGRQRNMMHRGDDRIWPFFGLHKFKEIAPILQYQVVQKTKTNLEVRLVTERPLTEKEEDSLTNLINKSVGYNFEINYTYYPEEIPRPISYKYEQFICEIV